jgi:drug/metabolite transporter (DMT)-like permease
MGTRSYNFGLTPGVAALLASVGIVTFMTMAQRQALDDGAASLTILSWQCGVAGAVALATQRFAARRGGRGVLSRQSLAGGVLLALTIFMTIEGIDRLPVGIFVVLIFAAPVWVAVYDVTVRGHALTGGVIASLAAVLLGLTIMVDPLSLSLDLVGIVYGLVASIMSAALFLILDSAQAAHGVRPATESVLLVSAVVAIGIALAVDPGSLAPSNDAPEAAVAGLSVGAWCLLFVIGLEKTSPLLAAIVCSLEPVAVAAAAYAYFGEKLALHELAGGAILLLGVLLAARYEGGDRPEGRSGPTRISRSAPSP